jgi:hypothetical protein
MVHTLPFSTCIALPFATKVALALHLTLHFALRGMLLCGGAVLLAPADHGGAIPGRGGSVVPAPLVVQSHALHILGLEGCGSVRQCLGKPRAATE